MPLLQVTVSIDPGPESDEHEVAELSRRLRETLLDTDVETVEVARGGTAPAGAKAGDALQWGTLVVTVLSSGALTGLIETAKTWVGRQKHGSLRVKIGDDELELSSAAPAEQQRVVEEWLRRRGTAGGDA